MDTKQTRHAKYNINYHFVFCPKYRRPVLTGDISDKLIQLIEESVISIGGEIIELVVRPDHVHLFGEFPPTLAPSQIMHAIKGKTSHDLRTLFPQLKSRLPSLWSRSYYVGTAGNMSADTIRKYIENQAGK
jgi:putative transposase